MTDENTPPPPAAAAAAIPPPARPAHRIRWALTPGRVVASVTCTAEVGAPCRLMCEQGWCPNPTVDDRECDHALEDAGECLAARHLELEGAQDCYAGEPGALRNGPISLTRHGFRWTWLYWPGLDDDFAAVVGVTRPPVTTLDARDPTSPGYELHAGAVLAWVRDPAHRPALLGGRGGFMAGGPAGDGYLSTRDMRAKAADLLAVADVADACAAAARVDAAAAEASENAAIAAAAAFASERPRAVG